MNANDQEDLIRYSDIPQVTAFDASAVEMFVKSFIGFGSPASPVWFLSWGAHYGREATLPFFYRWQNVEQRARRSQIETAALLHEWSQANARYLDLQEYARRISRPLGTAKPLTPSTRCRLARLHLHLTGVASPTHVQVRQVLAVLGGLECNSFLAEFSPLTRPIFYRLAHQMRLPWKRHGEVRAIRMDALSIAIAYYKPAIVYMFGRSGDRYWSRIAAQCNANAIGDRTWSSTATKFIASQCPAAPWMSHYGFEDLAHRITKLCKAI